MTASPLLLVSVRSAEEARQALAGGADVIDIKEPARGALGRADRLTMEAIADAVRDQSTCPLTAAAGELDELYKAPPAAKSGPHAPSRVLRPSAVPLAIPAAIAVVKVGLARQARNPDWPDRLSRWIASQSCPLAVVPVYYADQELSGGPDYLAVLDFACRLRADWPRRMAVGRFAQPWVLVDTHDKDGRGLWHWLTPPNFAAMVQQGHERGVCLAAAGALGLNDLPRFVPPLPDLVGVRSAACHAGQRTSSIAASRVAELKHALLELEACHPM